jgi:hypothetical protein
LAVSDVVIRGEVPADIRRSMELSVGCIAGALQEGEYREKLQTAGFESVEIEPTRVYQPEEAREFVAAAGLDADAAGAFARRNPRPRHAIAHRGASTCRAAPETAYSLVEPSGGSGASR